MIISGDTNIAKGTVTHHYDDVIMTTLASQITSLAIVYLIVYSDADQRKHQSSASLAFVRGIHRGPVNSPHKGPVTRKMFPFDDVIMTKRSLIMPRNYNSDITWALWHNGVSILRGLKSPAIHCLLISLFTLTAKISKLHIAGYSRVAAGFPSQRTINAKSCLLWIQSWIHHKF